MDGHMGGGGVIVSSANQNLPTLGYHVPQRGSPKKPLDGTHFKFEKRSNTARSRSLKSFALPEHSSPEENFGGNMLLDGSISLSTPYPCITNDLHASIATSLHHGVP